MEFVRHLVIKDFTLINLFAIVKLIFLKKKNVKHYYAINATTQIVSNVLHLTWFNKIFACNLAQLVTKPMMELIAFLKLLTTPKLMQQ